MPSIASARSCRLPLLPAGIAPGVGAVAAAVIGEDAFDGHAAVCEPGNRSLQDTDGGLALLVRTDLDVCDPGVVVDDGVQERGADQGSVVVSPVAGSAGGLLLVVRALLASDEAMAAAVGDVAELGDVDVDQRARVRVLVATDRFTGDSVDMAESVDPAAHQDRVHGRSRDAEPSTDLDWSEPVAPPQPDDLPNHRARRLVRARSRPARSVLHAGNALGPEPRRPLAGGRSRDHEHRGGL
jgi:hypothetical protein